MQAHLVMALPTAPCLSSQCSTKCQMDSMLIGSVKRVCCAGRLGLIGDLGQTDNSAQTLDHLTASNPGSVINVGDLSYADGYQPRSGALVLGQLYAQTFAL